MSRRESHGDPSPTPGELGLPEHSALTVEGRVERAAMVGTHLVRHRAGRERSLRRSAWAGGLYLIIGAFSGLIAALVVLYLVG